MEKLYGMGTNRNAVQKRERRARVAREQEIAAARKARRADERARRADERARKEAAIHDTW